MGKGGWAVEGGATDGARGGAKEYKTSMVSTTFFKAEHWKNRCIITSLSSLLLGYRPSAPFPFYHVLPILSSSLPRSINLSSCASPSVYSSSLSSSSNSSSNSIFSPPPLSFFPTQTLTFPVRALSLHPSPSALPIPSRSRPFLPLPIPPAIRSRPPSVPVRRPFPSAAARRPPSQRP